MPTQENEVRKVAERLAKGHAALRTVEIAYGTYWTGTYFAKWDRIKWSGGGLGNDGGDEEEERVSGSGEASGDEDNVITGKKIRLEEDEEQEEEERLGTLIFSESKRNILFCNNRMSDEAFGEVERAHYKGTLPSRFGHVLVWFRKLVKV